MKSTRHRATVGAIAASVLLFATAACGSGSNDSADSPPPGTAPETTVDVTAAPGSGAPDVSSTTPDAPTAEPGAGGDEPAPTAAPAVVPEALQFTAPLVGGGTFDGVAAAGKPTVFWFWAPT